MYKNSNLKIKLILDDINEIVNLALWYFTDPHFILDRKELIYSLLSVDERISDIKDLLQERKEVDIHETKKTK